ncbi:MAG: thioredoxin domain-containing protein [Acidobacteria bacterium]|nr:thioredoxin domain-containing protein [Acidobacteriota bacterium]
MQHTFGWNPDLKWDVSGIGPSEAPGITQASVLVNTSQGQQSLVLYITPDGKYAINGDLVPFGSDPFHEARNLLKQRANGPAKGPENAALTVVEFSDLQCPHCKAAVPVVDKLLGDNPEARFIFQSYPLEFHDWAFKGAAYSLCVHQQKPEAFWKFVQAVFDAQDSITAANADAKLSEIATASGADARAAAACSATPETKTKIDQSIALGKAVGVTGTPTLFLNGRRIQNITGTPYEVLTAITKYQAQSK